MSDIDVQILDKLTKVCICKAIPRSTIKKSILNGADTVAKVHEDVGSGSGSCGGKRCSEKIKELLDTVEQWKI